MSTFDDPDTTGQADDRTDPPGDRTGTLADSDINSEHVDGSGGGDSTAEAASGDDVERGNLDGSAGHAQPRQDALDAAQAQAEGQTDQRESGQDNGLSS